MPRESKSRRPDQARIESIRVWMELLEGTTSCARCISAMPSRFGKARSAIHGRRESHNIATVCQIRESPDGTRHRGFALSHAALNERSLLVLPKRNPVRTSSDRPW
jgi:hypothetical protein